MNAPEPKKVQEQDDIDKCVQYITRYTSRPIMAESRIVEYDDIHKTAHWFYHRHEDNERIDVKEPVDSFIKKVIMHCPNENFKMVRYYGFYSNKGTNAYNQMADLVGEKLRREIQNKKQRRAIAKRKEKQTHFRCNMIQSFQRDPLLCSCGQVMVYLETYDPLEGGKKNNRRYRDRCIIENKYLKKKTRLVRQASH